MTKKAIIYHDKCNDGICSVCVAIEAFKIKDNDILLIPALYKEEGNIFNRAELLKDREAIFLDFNLSPELMDKFLQLVKSATVIDHHKTSFDNYNQFYSHKKDGFTYLKYKENCDLILDLDRSGALMTWDYFNNKPAPKMVQYVSDGDLFQFKDKNTIPFLSRISAEEKSIKRFTELIHSPTELIDRYVSEGHLLAQQFDNMCKGFLEKTSEIVIDINGEKHYGTLVACGGDSSIRSRVGELIYEKNGTFAVMVSKMTDKTVEMSFRSSRKDPDNIYDILKIVTYFGGGGHETAGAATISMDDYHKHISFIDKKLDKKLKV